MDDARPGTDDLRRARREGHGPGEPPAREDDGHGEDREPFDDRDDRLIGTPPPAADPPPRVPGHASEAPEGQEATAAGPDATAPPGGLRSRSALHDPHRDGILPLGAAARELALLPRLARHPAVAPRGSPALRTMGIVLVTLGLAALAYERRSLLTGPSPPAGLAYVAAAALATGALAWALGLFVPPGRRVRVRLFATQQDEWQRAVALARRQRGLHAAGLVLWLSGLAAIVVRYHLGGDVVSGLAIGATAAAAGLVLLLVAWSRWRLARWAYVQTLVLAWVERAGLVTPSASEARTRDMLQHMAAFIRDLPEEHRRRFEATEAARRLPDMLKE